MTKLYISGKARSNKIEDTGNGNVNNIAGTRRGFGYSTLISNGTWEKLTSLFPIKAKESGATTHSIWSIYDRDTQTLNPAQDSLFDWLFIGFDIAETDDIANEGSLYTGTATVQITGSNAVGAKYNLADATTTHSIYTFDFDNPENNGRPIPASFESFSMPQGELVPPDTFLQDMWGDRISGGCGSKSRQCLPNRIRYRGCRRV